MTGTASEELEGTVMTAEISYLRWLSNETPTNWWHDSPDPDELAAALAHGAVGVTTNPVLTNQALRSKPDFWNPIIADVPRDLKPHERAEALMQRVIQNTARVLEPIYERTSGQLGYVCAQVNPTKAGDAETMLALARRFHDWAPNIAVKLPVTVAGLEVLEECAAEGITITATVSFSVAQAIAVAEHYRRGLKRCRDAGKAPGRCFSVLMVGRVDDYLRDVVWDRKANVTESDLRQAGLAVAKRAYAIYKEKEYEPVLMPAGLRGPYHVTEVAGSDMILSIHPKVQAMIFGADLPREERIHLPIAPDVIKRLETVDEFVRVYEPDGMSPEEFITYGVEQRTLSQFVETGWLMLESFKL